MPQPDLTIPSEVFRRRAYTTGGSLVERKPRLGGTESRQKRFTTVRNLAGRSLAPVIISDIHAEIIPDLVLQFGEHCSSRWNFSVTRIIAGFRGFRVEFSEIPLTADFEPIALRATLTDRTEVMNISASRKQSSRNSSPERWSLFPGLKGPALPNSVDELNEAAFFDLDRETRGVKILDHLLEATFQKLKDKGRDY